MNQAGARLQAKGADHPLDLAPAAEMDDIAEVTALPGAAARFGHGMVAEMGNEFRGLGESAPAGDVNVVVQANPPACRWGRCSRQPVAKLLRCNGEDKIYPKASVRESRFSISPSRWAPSKYYFDGNLPGEGLGRGPSI